MTPSRACAVGEAALIWLAARPDDLGRFLAAAGMAPGEVRGRASDPLFLGFVLDFVLGEEALARAFAADERLAQDDTLRARAALPGGDAPHWT
jgi:hypothetical protein